MDFKEWAYNIPQEERWVKQLEGWVYKEDYEKDKFKYDNNPSLWNAIPYEYSNIKLKQ